MSDAPGDPAHPPSADESAGPDRSKRGGATVVLPILVAAVVLLALTGGWQTLQARDSAASLTTQQQQQSPPVDAAPAPTTSQSRPPAPSDSALPDPAVSPPPKPTPKPAAKPTAKPTASAPDRSEAVTVLNATTRTGLAASVARTLRDKGWSVQGVGNWRGGGVGRTTVFATGSAQAARTLRGDVGASGAVGWPRRGMPTSGLVLVVGADYSR